ncbi:MAG: hypothetical protein QOH48_146 [Actinomycetota bacterium]|nr:hypothetical protein [Actinomycetota bacterium]
MDLVLIGAGRVGTAVALLLQQSGHRVVGVASRSSESAARGGRLLNAPVFDVSRLPAAETVLLGVPAGAIEDLGHRVAGQGGFDVVCHFAGSVGISPLQAATEAGMFAAAIHPVQSCPEVAAAVDRLPGSAWGVTASPEVARWAFDLITNDLHGLPVTVAEADRPVWHAAAVVTANGAAALMSLGEAMLAEIGIDHPQTVLGPLLAGTVSNAEGRGVGNAERPRAAATLTGPFVRGEAATVRSHVEALRGRAPHLLEAYRLIAQTILLAAVDAGRLETEVAGVVRRELER